MISFFSDMAFMIAVSIWFSALRYLISSFKDSTWLQPPTDWCFCSSDFFTTNICPRKKDFNVSISAFNPLSVTYKMVKHTPQKPTNWLSLLDHFVGLALEGLNAWFNPWNHMRRSYFQLRLKCRVYLELLVRV